MFLASWTFIFHGCVPLFAPNKYLPLGSMNGTSIVLVRKPPFYFWRRLVGLVLSVVIFLIFTMGGLYTMVRPETHKVSFGKSSRGSKWFFLAFGLFLVAAGYLMLFRPHRSVEMLFTQEPGKLQDPDTRWLWQIYVRMAGVFCCVFSLLLLSEFVKNLR
jgi:hypothetical protein